MWALQRIDFEKVRFERSASELQGGPNSAFLSDTHSAHTPLVLVMPDSERPPKTAKNEQSDVRPPAGSLPSCPSFVSYHHHQNQTYSDARHALPAARSTLR